MEHVWRMSSAWLSICLLVQGRGQRYRRYWVHGVRDSTPAASTSPTRCWRRGYGRLNDAVREAMAMAALIAHVRSGRIAVGSRVLFVHTGGPPALFAYAESLGYWLSEAPEAPAR